MKRNLIDASQLELEDKVVSIKMCIRDRNFCSESLLRFRCNPWQRCADSTWYPDIQPKIRFQRNQKVTGISYC